WYHNNTNTPISGATNMTYEVQASDIGKKLIFGVTPKAKTGVNLVGTQASSIVAAAVASSVITTVNPVSITANNSETANLSLNLKDIYGAGITGKTVTFASSLAGTSVSATTGVNGTYTATIKGTTQGVAVITPKVLEDAALVIEAPSLTLATPITLTILVDGKNFDVTSNFPTTGFIGANFQLQFNGNNPNIGDYTWTSSQPWVTVGGTGKVSFDGIPTSSTKSVTITATPVLGGKDRVTYTFTVNNWFTPTESTRSFDESMNKCFSQGSILPTRNILTDGMDVRGVGSLYGEWGNLGSYKNSRFPWSGAALSEYRSITLYESDSNQTYGVFLYDGYYHHYSKNLLQNNVCVNNL
ncbi:Ig-like domain-containing protein, partial [Serratia sp. N21D137]|uniref:Ig-like domain-containing protein n=1 Tax=Serratia sp. N21D137 TaxID=3397495 RepID=UPI0039E131CC